MRRKRTRRRRNAPLSLRAIARFRNGRRNKRARRDRKRALTRSARAFIRSLPPGDRKRLFAASVGVKASRVRRKNPLLQIVKPNRTRRNPPIRGYAGRNGANVRGGQRISGVRFASASEARKFPGFAKALTLFKRFHGRAPSHFTRYRIEDGQPGVRRRAVVLIGEAPAIEYRTWRYANSTKSHTPDGRRIVWRHKMGEQGGKPAYYVHDPLSGVTELHGGTYKVAGKPAFYHH